MTFIFGEQRGRKSRGGMEALVSLFLLHITVLDKTNILVETPVNTAITTNIITIIQNICVVIHYEDIGIRRMMKIDARN